MMKIALGIALAAATLTSFSVATPAHAGCTTEFKVTFNASGGSERQQTRTCDQPAVLTRPVVILRPAIIAPRPIVLQPQNCKTTFTTTLSSDGRLTRQATRACG